MENLGTFRGYSGIHLTPKDDMMIAGTLVKSGQTVNCSTDETGKINSVEFI